MFELYAGRIAEPQIRLLISSMLCLICLSFSAAATGQQISAPEPQAGTVIGTVIDINGGVIPRATVLLQGPSPNDDPRGVANDSGFFQFGNIKPGGPYHLTVNAAGFASWTSPEITISPGQYFEVTEIQLRVATAVTTVRAAVSNEEIATEQVKAEEKQRVLGIIPNFYVVYDRDVIPLTPGLKFNLALKAFTDPVTFLGAASVAGIDQAANLHDYQQGARGYGKRLSAAYTNFFTGMMIGDAILPSVLHQDPRYFYQGTGTTKSRLIHALSNPFVCRGDNGRRQPNYSAWGGYLASGAISNAFYPASNRGPGLVFSTALIDVAQSMANGVLQEFVLRKLTPTAKKLQF